MHFYQIMLSLDGYTSVRKFYSFMMFNLVIDAVILLLNCFVLIFCLHMHLTSHTLVSLSPNWEALMMQCVTYFPPTSEICSSKPGPFVGKLLTDAQQF